jgi:DNA-directed RNA polymerase II subunit RPB2
MTCAQVLECVCGKIDAIKGVFSDATPFNKISINEVTATLEKLGFNGYGYETLYNGTTGKPFRTMIFIGPTYYQRLKHLVSEKIHARSIGAMQMSTRQPLEGRSVDGGYRFGEMELWCMLSHGLAHFLLERFMECSDGYECWICEESGFVAIANPEKKIFYGKSLDNYHNVKKIKIPYTCKQFIYQCLTCGLGVKIMPKKQEL